MHVNAPHLCWDCFRSYLTSLGWETKVFHMLKPHSESGPGSLFAGPSCRTLNVSRALGFHADYNNVVTPLELKMNCIILRNPLEVKE